MNDRAVIARSAAKAAGLKFFFTGIACKNGHVSDRYSVNGHCVECEKARKQAPEYRARHRAYMSEFHAREDVRVRREAFQRTDEFKAWRSDYMSKWWRSPKGLALGRKHNGMRRARKSQAVPPWFGELDDLVMVEASDLARVREVSTGIPWEVDHMVPMAARIASGLHCAANIQVIPNAVNRSKRNRLVLTHPGEWIRHL